VAADRVKALAFSSAMHGLMAVDAAGRPLMRMMSWADGRAREAAEKQAGEALAADLFKRTGCPPTALYYPARLRWLQAAQLRLFNAASRFCSLKDWIVQRLAGRWTMDRSHASSNGLLNIHDLNWDEAALAAAGIGPERLPELVDADGVVG
jgi:gluconokinase